MSIKKIDVRICDNCEKEIHDDILIVSPAGKNKCSEIILNKKVYQFVDMDFCSIECFIDNVKQELY